MGHGFTTKADIGAFAAPTWHRLGWTSGEREGLTSDDIRREAPDLFVPRRLITVYGAMDPLDLSDSYSLISPASMVDGGNRRMIVSQVSAPTDENPAATRIRVHGLATDGYHIWQPVDALAWADSLVSEGKLRYESAFGQNDGNEIVFVCRLPESFTLGKKDKTLAYVLIIVPFTGNKAIVILPTGVRVVCANTKGMAKRDAKGKLAPNGECVTFRLRHSSNLDSRLVTAHKHLAQFDEEFRRAANEAEALASRVIVKGEAVQLLEDIFPKTGTDGKPLEGAKATNREIKVRVVLESFKAETKAFERMGESAMIGSAWHWLNAYTRAADHGATIEVPGQKGTQWRPLEHTKGSDRQRQERGFLSAATGSLASMKGRAGNALLQLAGIS